MRRYFFILFSIATLLHAAEPGLITKESAPTFYRAFKRLTTEPRYIAPLTANLCYVPKGALDKERAITGPHARVAVHIYANPAAAESIAANAAEFPVGAVIVKEKLGRDKAVSDIGGMVKRPKGFDPANGDWEFFFYTPGGEFSTGKLTNCIDCHNGAKQAHGVDLRYKGKRDHVFSVWSLQSK